MAHIKNVDSFEKLLAICTGYGGQYNPGQQNLQLQSLSALLGNARNALRAVIVAKADYDNATNSREVAFGKLDKLVTRILAELTASGALEQTIADARSVVRQMSGRRRVSRPAAPLSNAAEPVAEVRTHSGGNDFATKEHFFEKLLQILAAEVRYQPTVEELKVSSLQDRLLQLREQNSAVALHAAQLGKARRNRNAVFYLDATNLYGTAMAVKDQVKAIYGFGSSAHRAVSSVSFNKPNR